MNAPARVMFAGDWHASIPAAQASVKHAAEMGAQWIVHVGDFFYTSQIKHDFLRSLDKALSKHEGLNLVFVRGNHDDTESIKKGHRTALDKGTLTKEGFVPFGEHIFWAIDGMRWTWEGVQFTALGGAASIDRAYRVAGKTWWADETTSMSSVDRVASGGKTDILVCHDAPVSAYLGPLLPDEASHDNRQRIQLAVDACKPKFAFAGHFHRYLDQELTYPDGSKGRHLTLNQGDIAGREHDTSTLSESTFFMDLQDGEAFPTPPTFAF